jgi:ribosomal protein S18 acetylase RimI-like enzyme
MGKLIIRDATLLDLPVLLGFEQKLIEAERPFDITIKRTPISYYDIEAYIKNDEVKVVVAEEAGKIVSSGYALKKEARHYLNHKFYGYLGFMYTDKEYRGKGINRKITEVLKEWCKANGLHEIRLTVYDENISAIKAYEKAGFKAHIVEMRLD